MAKQLEEMVKKSARERTTREQEKEAAKWLQSKAKTASKENTLRRNKRRTSLLGDESKIANKIEVGSMYLYNYDAKFKKTLPYYDTFPCIMLVDFDKTGHFLGLNLHYLPPLLRAKLLDAIMDLETYKSEKQRAKMRYSIITSFAGSDLAKPCLKKYLYSHVVSNFIEIVRDDWHYIAALPLANFVSETGSSSITRVYADSRRRN